MDREAGTTEIQARGAEPGGMSFGQVGSSLRRSPWLVTLVVVVAAAAAAAVWVFLPVPKMTGYALFQIHASQPHILNPSDKQDFNLFRQSQAAMVKNRVVLNAALRDPAVRGAAVLKGDDKLTALENALKVDFKVGPEFMRVAIEGDNGDELRAVINAVAQAYLDDVVNKKKNMNADRRTKLSELESQLLKDIQNAGKQLSDRLEFLTPLSAEEARAYARAEKAELTRRKLEAESQLRDAQVELQMAKNPGRKNVVPEQVAASAVRDRLASDPEYQVARDRRDRLKAEIEATRRTLAPGKTTPTLDAHEAEVRKLDETCTKKEEQTRREIDALATKLGEQNDQLAAGRLQNRIQYLQQLIAAIDRDYAEVGREGGPPSGDVYDIEWRRTKLGRDRDLLARTQSELLTLKLEADAPDRVTRLDADVVSGVEGARRSKFAAIAGLGILVLGLGLLVWRESRNPRVIDSRRISGELGLPLIGVLPSLRSGPASATGPASDPNWQLALGEAVSAARTILQYGVSGPRPARTILVGSALSGEGKTSAALLLARSLAQAGHRTLLIDGDLRRPHMHIALNLASRVGLCEYLAGTATATDILQPTAIPELTAIAAGQWSAAGNQGLTTGRWSELVTQAAEQYEYVIIDSAPILPVADTLVMARSVDGVLLAVMREVSEFSAVKETLAQLALVGTRVLGVVMNGGSRIGYYRPRYNPVAAPAPPLAG